MAYHAKLLLLVRGFRRGWCMQVWSTNNIEGVHRFLARVYRLIAEQPLSQDEPSPDQIRLLHATIKKVCPAACMHKLVVRGHSFNTGPCFLVCGSCFGKCVSD